MKHHAQRSGGRPASYDFRQFAGEFFFQSSRACASPFGWTVSGASLRKPCRAKGAIEGR